MNGIFSAASGEQVLIHIELYKFTPEKSCPKANNYLPTNNFRAHSCFQGRKNKPCIGGADFQKCATWVLKKKQTQGFPGWFRTCFGDTLSFTYNSPTRQVVFSLFFTVFSLTPETFKLSKGGFWGWIRWSSETKKKTIFRSYIVMDSCY